MTEKDLVNWIHQALVTENEDYEIDFGGTSAKTDGYMGDIRFITVTSGGDGGKKTLHLVVKIAKQNKALRNSIPVELFFKEEIYIYQNIFAAFRKFQINKGIKTIFEPYPKCFKTIIEPDTEVIILENLKTAGYELHDRTRPLNMNHLKIVLTEYGKLHALSFAMKLQKPQDFENLVRNAIDTVKMQFDIELFADILKKEFNFVLEILKTRNENDIYERYNELVQHDIINTVRKILTTNNSFSVLSHGDSWINNFLFLYEGKDKSTPVKISLIDWQLSTFRCSPVFDLSHFLYCCASSADLSNLEYLLEFYYKSLSKSLMQLGNSPEEIFTFEDLKSHWKQFSIFGATLAVFVLKQSFWDSKDAPDMDHVFETEDEEKLRNVISDIVIRDKTYYERLIAVHRNLVCYKWTE